MRYKHIYIESESKTINLFFIETQINNNMRVLFYISLNSVNDTSIV